MQIENNNKQQRATIALQTLGAAFWSFSGNSLQLVLRLATIVVLSRLLTAKDFGVVNAALLVVALVEMFALLGVGPAIVQRPNLAERHIRVGFTLSVGFGLLFLALVWFTAPAVASFYHSEDLVPVLRTIAFIFPISSIGVIAESLMQRELKFRLLVGLDILSYTIGSGIVGIGMALTGFGLWSLIAGYLIQAFIKTVGLLIYQSHPKMPQFDRQTFNELVFFGSGLSLAQVFNYFGLQGDNIVVGRWLGVDALGLYGRAFQVMIIPVTLFGNVIDKVMFPAMSKVQHDPELLALSYRRSVALVGLAILPLSVVEYLLAPELVIVVLGPAWSQIILPFRILILGTLFRASYKISVALTRATGTVYRNAARQFIYALLVIVSSWIGQYWGLIGVSFGVLIAVFIHFLLMTQLALSLLPMNWGQIWSINLPCLWSACVIGLTTWSIATITRSLDMSPIITLVMTLPFVLVVTLLLIQRLPLLLLGSDGIWILGLIQERLPKRWAVFDWLSRRAQLPSK